MEMPRTKKTTRSRKLQRRPLPYIRPTLLREDNPVHWCVSEMRNRLRPFRHSALLLNGKLEMLIKAFIGTAWEGKSHTHAFVMDKHFKADKSRPRIGGIDFLALKQGHSQFWIETKCSFFEDPRDGERSARSALKQTDATVGRLQAELTNADVYIVHFVNSSPFRRAHLFREFVLDKFPTGSKRDSSLDQKEWNRVVADRRKEHIEALEQIYVHHRGKRAGRRYQSSAIIPISRNPLVDAIVVKLAHAP
jgi:hypothetical protein